MISGTLIRTIIKMIKNESISQAELAANMRIIDAKYGNGNGHFDFEDVKEICTDAFDVISDIVINIGSII